MADNNLNPSAPDLASILRTLSAFSSPPLPSVTPQPQPQLQHTHATPQPQHSQSQNHNRTSSNPPKAETPARPDSTKITSWRPALQYVVHHIAPQPSHLFKIRKLIQVQRTHERQWWEGRVALVQKQEGRIEGKRKLDEVLRAVGGSVDDGGDVSVSFPPILVSNSCRSREGAWRSCCLIIWLIVGHRRLKRIGQS